MIFNIALSGSLGSFNRYQTKSKWSALASARRYDRARLCENRHKPFTARLILCFLYGLRLTALIDRP